MPPRPREIRNRDLPDNLHLQNGYYRWRDPRSGKSYGLGRDKRTAIRQAMEANSAVRGELASVRLLDRVTGEADRLFSSFMPTYKGALAKRKLAPKTVKERVQQLDVLETNFGGKIMARVNTRAVAEFLETYERAGKDRTAQVYRSLLLDVFREAQAKGWVDENPVTVTKAAIAHVRRSRLSLDEFKAIYAKAENLEPWVANSMALAIVTAQRREDVVGLRFSDARDGFLWVDQGKTGTKLRIPLGMRLNALGWSIDEVIRRCRDDVVSSYMVHSVRYHARAKPGDRLHESSLSSAFAKARVLARIKGTGGTPPTFHELRSLAERLYATQGIDTQTLLGHKDPRMTASYHDARGSEWLEVKC